MPTAIVTVSLIQDGVESGEDAIVRFSTDDSSQMIPVNYSVGGTAIDSMNYEALSGAIEIPMGEDHVDLHIIPIDDEIHDGNQTVSITVEEPGYPSWYTVGSPNTTTATIVEDIDQLPVLIHQESFQLTGSGQSVSGMLTVTYNAPTVPYSEGTYTWQYQLTNDTSSTTWTSFTVPVSGDTSDVGNVQADSGWSGSIVSNTVSWTATGAGLTANSTANFSFTTAPRDVGDTNTPAVSLTDGTATVNADTPKTGPTSVFPKAQLAFFDGRNKYTITLSITTASGHTYTTDPIPVDQNSPHDAREQIIDYLQEAGWTVQTNGNSGIRIRGVYDGTKVDGIKTMSSTVTNLQSGQGFSARPSLTGPPNITVTNP